MNKVTAFYEKNKTGSYYFSLPVFIPCTWMTLFRQFCTEFQCFKIF